jgi:hypothetical protein
MVAACNGAIAPALISRGEDPRIFSAACVEESTGIAIRLYLSGVEAESTPKVSHTLLEGSCEERKEG